MAASIPTLRPLYLVLLEKPGAAAYKSRTKTSYPIRSSKKGASMELQESASDTQRELAKSGADMCISPLELGAIQQTTDFDVRFDRDGDLQRTVPSAWFHAKNTV